MGSFCSAKAPHIFSAKNISTLDFRRTRRLNESLTNDFVKLTMLWTTGPRMFTVRMLFVGFQVFHFNWILSSEILILHHTMQFSFYITVCLFLADTVQDFHFSLIIDILTDLHPNDIAATEKLTEFQSKLQLRFYAIHLGVWVCFYNFTH